MILYNKLTIIRNQHRAREIRIFRGLVEAYFEQVSYDTDEQLIHWESARAARARIHRMLPRIVQIVQAARLNPPSITTTDPGPAVPSIKVLHNMFEANYSDSTEQEILDLLDMALGVYEANGFSSFIRTVNPIHYTVTALVFVANLPRNALRAIGLLPQPHSRTKRLRPADIDRLEAVANRMQESEQAIESRLKELRDRQAQHFDDHANQLADIAERLDFAERVIAQQKHMKQIPAPDGSEVETPV